LETLVECEVVDHGRDRRFKGGTWRDVDDFATERTEQVMMVMGKVFGQLESSELVVGRDAAHHARSL
jgi:hypothetical protein